MRYDRAGKLVTLYGREERKEDNNIDISAGQRNVFVIFSLGSLRSSYQKARKEPRSLYPLASTEIVRNYGGNKQLITNLTGSKKSYLYMII
jgi:hypothetical protein